MLTNHDIGVLCVLIFLCILIILLLRFVRKQKNKKLLHKTFTIIFALMLNWMGWMILQILFMEKLNIDIKYFFDLYYLSLCFLPVAFFFMVLSFVKSNVEFNKKQFLLFIIPILSMVLLVTNDFHHLFYKEYSIDVSTEYGWYFYVHTFYTYGLFVVALVILLKYSIKNAGFFSKQAILIIIGALAPLTVNVLGSLQFITISIYTTPIALAFTIICFTFAIFKFDLFKITPIALQRIVDRISDSYIILSENYSVSDFNQTFIDTFEIKNNIRGKNFEDLLKESGAKSSSKDFYKRIKDVTGNDKTESFEVYVAQIEKYFNVEISSIIANGQSLGILILFKDITQHKKDMQIIKNNQDMLVERERLASLGQMVGGIAHSLKTPIFSISGGIEGLNDLIREFDESIDDPEVNSQDMHDIARDMNTWTEKMKEQLSYMSEVITTVKGQAVNLSGEDDVDYTISELFSHVNILMKHELQTALIKLNIENKVSNDIMLYGNINNLVQVLNNLISNAIQAYDGEPEKEIDMKAELDGNNILITIKDYGHGIPDSVKDKLFKEMITTKGKEGTGLGLFMSYSMIKAKFNGDIKYKTSKNGTEFTIYLPIKR